MPVATQSAVVGILVLLPALLLVAKNGGFPFSDVLARKVSLDAVDPSLRDKVGDILFVPIGGLVVVFFRLTLGLRVLGPFRSILLAFAFIATGVVVGLGFLAVTVAALLAVRPLVKTLHLPYFGRISVMLSFVAIAVVAGVLAGSWIGASSLQEVAYLPVVVVCLVGEALARSVRREGARSGIWRAGATVAAAVTVASIASVGTLRLTLQRNPELILFAVAAIVLTARFLNLRLLQGLNPKLRVRPDSDDDIDPLVDDPREEREQ